MRSHEPSVFLNLFSFDMYERGLVTIVLNLGSLMVKKDEHVCSFDVYLGTEYQPLQKKEIRMFADEH